MILEHRLKKLYIQIDAFAPRHFFIALEHMISLLIHDYNNNQ